MTNFTDSCPALTTLRNVYTSDPLLVLAITALPKTLFLSPQIMKPPVIVFLPDVDSFFCDCLGVCAVANLVRQFCNPPVHYMQQPQNILYILYIQYILYILNKLYIYIYIFFFQICICISRCNFSNQILLQHNYSSSLSTIYQRQVGTGSEYAKSNKKQ